MSKGRKFWHYMYTGRLQTRFNTRNVNRSNKETFPPTQYLIPANLLPGQCDIRFSSFFLIVAVVFCYQKRFSFHDNYQRCIGTNYRLSKKWLVTKSRTRYLSGVKSLNSIPCNATSVFLFFFSITLTCKPQITFY